ncbi:MAG: universal stress protein [Gammaproteobacteria bacterium]|nr:universal stress protein [Gammaproteobacteria bacterium]
MNTAHNILLASHGTDGALAAEQMALKLCNKGSHLHHLIVVPTLWKGMTGDDWLNNGSTRDTFRRYLEAELGREVDEHISRVSQAATEHELNYSNDVIIGEPNECLLDASKKNSFDLIIVGSPRPKGKQGLRSRMVTDLITQNLTVPILIVPYPSEQYD